MSKQYCPRCSAIIIGGMTTPTMRCSTCHKIFNSPSFRAPSKPIPLIFHKLDVVVKDLKGKWANAESADRFKIEKIIKLMISASKCI